MPDRGRVCNARFPKSSKQDKGLLNRDNSSAAWRQGNGLNDLSRPHPTPKSVCTLPSRWPSLPFPPKHLLKKKRHVVAPTYRNQDKPRLGPALETKHSATADWGAGAFLLPVLFPLPWRLHTRSVRLGLEDLSTLGGFGLVGRRDWGACISSIPSREFFSKLPELRS